MDIYMFYRQRNNTLSFIYLYSTYCMFRLQTGHLQVLQVSQHNITEL
jgi:hypothetical protein